MQSDNEMQSNTQLEEVECVEEKKPRKKRIVKKNDNIPDSEE